MIDNGYRIDNTEFALIGFIEPDNIVSKNDYEWSDVQTQDQFDAIFLHRVCECNDYFLRSFFGDAAKKSIAEADFHVEIKLGSKRGFYAVRKIKDAEQLMVEIA